MIERRVLISSIFFLLNGVFSLSLSLSLFVVVVVVFNKKILLLAFNSNLMIIIRMNELNLLIFYLLRSNGTSTSQRFNISNSSYAYAYDSTGCLFGQGADIYVKSDSNVNTGSYTYFCFSYNCQHNKSYGWNAQIYLSGNLNGWFTTEIEVYQMS